MKTRQTPATYDEADARIDSLRGHIAAVDHKRHWAIWVFLAGTITHFVLLAGMIVNEYRAGTRAHDMLDASRPERSCTTTRCDDTPEYRAWIARTHTLEKNIREPAHAILTAATIGAGSLSVCFMVFAFGVPPYRRHVNKKIGDLYDLRDDLPRVAPPPPVTLRPENLKITKAVTVTAVKIMPRAIIKTQP